MTTNHALPPELQAEGQSLDPALTSTWAMTANASPLATVEAPDPERMRAIGQRLAAFAPARMRIERRRRYWAMAASIVLLVAAGLYATSRPVHIETATGVDIELPDGSTLSLAPGSEVVHDRGFGRSHRRLSLSGAALFDVRSEDVPFVVATPELTVTVLGTKFSVDAAGEGFMVYVTAGEVEVATQGQAVRLAAREGIRADAGNLTTFSADDAATPDLFIHIKQPLGVMFDAVEERFDIEVMAEERIRQHVHNFKHEITTVEALISDLCRSVTSMTLRYRATAAGFEILAE